MNSPTTNPPTTQSLPGSESQLPIPELRDIVVPNEVHSYWLAPGWIAIILLSVLICFGLVYYARALWQKNAYRRQALKELNNWYGLQKESALTTEHITFLSSLLKRVMLARYKSLNLAKLHSSQWQIALKELSPNSLSPEAIEVLTHGIYKPAIDTSLTTHTLKNQCHKWLKNFSSKRKLNIEANNAGI